MMNARIRVGSLVVAALSATAIAGCGGSSGNTETPGTVSLALDVAPGITLATVAYAINGPGAFAKTGSIDVSHSSVISADLSPLPPGVGFQLQLAAMSVDGATTCMGSQTFDVAAHQTTSVLVHLLCKQPTKNGSVSVNGVLDICPVIDSVGASPAEVFVGGSISLSGRGHDTDAGPGPLAYQWSAAGGMLTSATGADATFTCTAAGPVTVTLTLSDGDASCADTQSTTVTCTATSP